MRIEPPAGSPRRPSRRPGTSATTAWLNGGTATALPSLQYRSGHALRLRAATLSIAPGQAAAAIVNIGYHHPADAPKAEAASTSYAEAGGYETARDIAAYNATREYWAGGGPRASAHPVRAQLRLDHRLRSRGRGAPGRGDRSGDPDRVTRRGFDVSCE
ncbi:hypothetical protein ABIA39_006276 [Nocardia sp. GAS34]